MFITIWWKLHLPLENRRQEKHELVIGIHLETIKRIYLIWNILNLMLQADWLNSAKWFISQATRSKHAYIYKIFRNFIIRKREDQCSLHLHSLFTLVHDIGRSFFFFALKEKPAFIVNFVLTVMLMGKRKKLKPRFYNIRWLYKWC